MLFVIATPGAAQRTLNFFPLTPCRMVDTRTDTSGGALAPGTSRSFRITGNAYSGAGANPCSGNNAVPPDASAVAINLTLTQVAGATDLRLAPTPQMPTSSYMNAVAGDTIANAAVVEIGFNNFFIPAISALSCCASAHLIIDVLGYYSSAGQYADLSSVSPTVIAGHSANTATVAGVTVPAATIAGGGYASSPNVVRDAGGVIGGGSDNVAGNGDTNYNSAPYATVGGGTHNEATAGGATVGGGYSNQVTGGTSTIAGGLSNVAAGVVAALGGGQDNAASGDGATVAGGRDNVASGEASSVPGGRNNTASGTNSLAAGSAATAAGDYSFALGRRAKANANGSFVWADSLASDFAANVANSFRVRATGGVRFVVGFDSDGNEYYSCLLNSSTGGWSCSSDASLKEGFRPVDGREVLDRVVAMPISRWSWRMGPGVDHIGPMAQDFHAAFGLGLDDRHIDQVDAQGVALAAIQGLHDLLLERDGQLAERDRALAALDARVRALEAAATRSAAPE